MFASRVPTGVLDPDDVARARRRCREIEQGALTGSFLARDAEQEAEYQDWVVKVLAPARRNLIESNRDAGGNVRKFEPAPIRGSSRSSANASIVP